MTKWILCLLALFAVTASAADIAGTWKASLETPNGAFEITFNFKVDGDKFTGTSSSRMGDSPISDGKIDGDNISFNVKFNGQNGEVTIPYKGKVSGNEMKLTSSFGDRTFEITAKKTS